MNDILFISACEYSYIFINYSNDSCTIINELMYTQSTCNLKLTDVIIYRIYLKQTIKEHRIYAEVRRYMNYVILLVQPYVSKGLMLIYVIV